MTRTGIFSALARFVAWARVRRKQARTMRLLASLSPEIQADIGWPDLHVDGSGHFTRIEATPAEQRSTVQPRKERRLLHPALPECTV